MKSGDGQWPPLIVAASRPAWIRGRDFVLTTVMWLLLAAMMSNELGLFLGIYLERLGFGAVLERLGFGDAGEKFDWLLIVGRLGPYLVVVLALVLSLSTFALHTVRRRRNALGMASPQPLSLASQAHQAALVPMMGGEDDVSRERQVGLDDAAVVDNRSLLAMLNEQDEAALAEARRLRIALINVTAEGHYRIERPGEAVMAAGS